MKSILQCLLAFYLLHLNLLEANYQCGIRKIMFSLRMHRAWEAEEGQWPWHVALFHRTRANSFEYACGASLLSRTHVLTSAHCVLNRQTQYPLAPKNIELHFGQSDISHLDERVQVRTASRVYVHPEHTTHKNDIAIIEISSPVEYTDLIIPICLDQHVESDLRNLEGQRGWFAGWGTSESGVISDELQTASMPVVGYLQCINDEEALIGRLLSRKVFCAGERNGTGPGTGDSGGGMYFSEGDRWVLKGIVSFAMADGIRNEADTSKFSIFVYVPLYLPWIKEILNDQSSRAVDGPKRISARECDRFQRLTKKRANGICANSRYPHTVALLYPDGDTKCTGILVNENHVLTACHCDHLNSSIGKLTPTKVQIENYGTVGISEVTCHPQYDSDHLYHDLAVVKLSTAVELSRSLLPACLANNWTENLHDTLLQTGYGKSLFTGTRKFIDSDENQIISKKECDELSYLMKYSPLGAIPAQLCVINRDRMRATIVGPLGSPLQTVNTRSCMYTAVGVTSSGNFGPNYTVVDVYTRISYHLDWIEKVVWKADFPEPAVRYAGSGHRPYKI